MSKLKFLLPLIFIFSVQAFSDTKQNNSRLKSWTRLTNLLIADGLDKNTVYDIYGSNKMPHFSNVTFRLKPREAKSIYSGFNSYKNITKAKSFLKQHASIFNAVEKQYGVDKEIVAAIFLVETKFGSYTGNFVIIEKLSRLANVREENSLLANYHNLKRYDKSVKLEDVQARGKYLEDLFYPEVVALLKIAEKNNINVFAIKGSKAGAFGIPQFLPTSYQIYGVDWDNNGSVSLFDVQDAIASCANFLSSAGWKRGVSKNIQKEVIWQYNRSDAYVDTVLDIFNKLL